jgi:hypothetical protein
MLSVVVVGRNDNHGYNLGKRVATSLNSIAMRLSDGDEIIFVDWNTPRPFPPMPVSIIDDLTDEAKKFLKILVVSPEIHDSVKGGSSKMILEPIARNVGIRHADPKNSWILSTNTDIIFVGEETLKLRNIIEKLDERLWQSFRYEIPEYIWERFDKRNPAETNRNIQKLAKDHSIRLQLSTIPTSVKGNEVVFADAIGDFQLAPKDMWHKIKGFPEDMLNGWHVDSRAAYQMVRETKRASKILDTNFGMEIYHQNHLRSLTHFHSSATTNQIETISAPYENHLYWGLHEQDVYEFNLIRENSVLPFSSSNLNLINKSLLQEMHSALDYDLERTTFFLQDEISTLRNNDLVLVLSSNPELIGHIQSVSNKQYFEVKSFDFFEKSSEMIENISLAKLIVLDFGVISNDLLQSRSESIQQIQNSLTKVANLIPGGKRVAIIRAQNWALRTLISEYFSVPIFNNYSSVLTGHRNLAAKRLSQVKLFVMKSFIQREFDAAIGQNMHVESSHSTKFYRRVKRLIPGTIKVLLKKFLGI